jgi:hypothetical protein
MTAKELMIGDLVLIKPEMKPIKVAAVHQKKIGYHVRADKLNWVRFGLLEPIPLTPELLEANEAKIKKKNNRVFDEVKCTLPAPKDSWFEEIGQKIDFSYINEEPLIVSTLNNENYDRVFTSNIRYVHQLQHAFRMLNYDDLADNFRVI